jgi:Transcriptional regulator containing an amidase domain and an AraC-type DNA-binding HTH domain
VDEATFHAVLASTSTVDRPLGPAAYDCVKVVVIRSGSAIMFTDFGEATVCAGDVILLGTNVLCRCEPDGYVTVTTIYLDLDYLLDQLFWQYADVLRDRLDALNLARKIYGVPAQVLRLGTDRAVLLAPWLDDLVKLSSDGGFGSHFHKMQGLWSAIIEVIAPFIRTSPVDLSPSRRASARPVVPRDRRFAPIRPEALLVRDVLRERMTEPWSLSALAQCVHLSPRQLSRVFADAYGKTPRAYLTMLRVEEMARLLRETDLSIAEVGWRVGWQSRSRACEAFRERTGMAPRHYRDAPTTTLGVMTGSGTSS